MRESRIAKSRVSSAWRCVALLLQLLALLPATLAGARAATANADPGVRSEPGDTLASAVRTFDGLADHLISAADRAAACVGQAPGGSRLVVVAGQPSERELEACRQQTAFDVLAVTIGYQAVVLVTPANAPVFPLRSVDLFRAVARHAGQLPLPAVWRDVNAALPDLPVGLLAPPTGSVARRLLMTYVMEPACSRVRGTHVPFELASRMDYCSLLRADPAITQRNGGTGELADWAKSSPDGWLAAVTVPELRQLDRGVVVLPLDGALPTADNIESGRYPAAETVVLLIVLPHEMSADRRDAMRQSVFELLSERGIGPQGRLAQAGLIAMPPAERVATRASAVAFVEHP